jgi:prepilin-type N-terminal cleavage/methylation domain-containing protein
MKRLRLCNERGDTIIEVIVVVAILGLAFASSYAIANVSVTKTRNSQEHSEALQNLTSQIEILRNAEASDVALTRNGAPFCMDGTVTPTYKPVPVTDASCNLGPDGRYSISVVYSAFPQSGVDQDIYTFTANWEGIGNLGPQRERISYKLHAL